MARLDNLKPRPLWVLTGAGLLLTVVTVLWIRMDFGICPPTDSEHHLFGAIQFSRTIRIGGAEALWETMRKAYVGWPPAAKVLLYGPLGATLGDHSQSMRLYNVALLPLLLWGTYFIGRSMGGRRSGVLAAVITIFSFGVSGQLRQVGIDLPATAAVLGAMALLLRSRAMSSPGGTLLFGAACGLCLLTRVQSLFFLIGPAVGVAVISLWRASSWRQRGLRLLWMVGGALLALAVCSPWWYGRLELLWSISTSHLDPKLVTPRGDPRFLPGLLFYLVAIGRINGWMVLFAAVCALPLLGWRQLRRGNDPVHVVILLTWIAGGILGAAYGVHREARYLLPLIPAVALLATLGCRVLPRRVGQPGAAVMALSVVLPTLWFSAFGIFDQSPLAVAHVVEWGYVRAPVYIKVTTAVRQANEALVEARESQPRARGLYLLFVQEGHVNYLPRLGSYLAPLHRDLVFSFTNNIHMVNSVWHQAERKQRDLFIFTETKMPLDLKPLWEISTGKYGNAAPIRMYRIPARHQFYGKIRRRHLRIAMNAGELRKHKQWVRWRKARQAKRRAARKRRLALERRRRRLRRGPHRRRGAPGTVRGKTKRDTQPGKKP